MKLWGGPSDTGCCSVADVDDARRVAQQLGIDHHVFNFSEEFDRQVVEPYVADHAAGRTPNPCIECNRHLKFDRLLARAAQLGFDAVATGHHARVVAEPDGEVVPARGARPATRTSPTCCTCCRRRSWPGSCSRSASSPRPRSARIAAGLGLRTAAKPDSQDVCFISRSGGRQAFLGRPDRLATRPGRRRVRRGRRRGAGGRAGDHRPARGSGAGPSAGPSRVVGQSADRTPGPIGEPRGRRYVVDVDVPGATVTVGPLDGLAGRPRSRSGMPAWVDGPPADGERLEVQMSAHGQPVPATWSPAGGRS